MRTWYYKFLLVVAPLVASASQTPFRYPEEDDIFSSGTAHKLEWPVKRVAVIGAGVGGLIAHRELAKDGFDVHVFERDTQPGGNWHYTDEVPLDAPVPNANIAVADFAPSLPPNGVKFPYEEEYRNKTQAGFYQRAHRAPKPIWYGLTSNAPAPIQQVREFPWPVGTEWALPNAKVGRYLRAFASWHGLNNNDNNPNISYNTRIELIEKHLDSNGKQNGWTLTTKELVRTSDGTNRATWNKERFDAVVIATGRYNAPNIPSIDGLQEWAKRFPEEISHSRQYRRPEEYAGKTIVIVGAATSGGEISREVNSRAAKIYQSVRRSKNPDRQVPSIADYIRRLPTNVSVIPEIKRFHSPGSSIQDSGIELANGTILYGVDHVLFATGYRYTYPFLPDYHNPTLGRTGEAPAGAPQPIITDGSHVRSLYLDLFYIDNPTLAFINVNFGMQSFTYAEFSSLAVSKVWSGKAHLPTREESWKLYHERVKKVGYGRHFQFLGAEGTKSALRFFQGWLNAAAIKYGGRQIDGLPSQNSQINSVWTRARFGDPSLLRNVTVPGADPEPLSADVFADEKEREVNEAYVENIVYADDW
ncbi:FAD/NAD(P)-binding domain-containing protein [Macrolepiota fuliginosa MF-IS2]|uniref:FAD/NAD(P)-binding domain-containing protein n=1 Tax=Macrolepiota fuliginosa MF-IS2 TaxID=1400762 RepID=A0A9P6BYG8_9AGAR|nr:FAD/NAD(P)-binding domain-containing protein [Macrolepiota fuliginosa MF-IS2]